MKICFCEQGGLVSLCCSSGAIFWNFMPTGEAKPAHACTVLDYSVKMICQSKKRHKIASWDSAKAVCSPNNTNRSSLTTHFVIRSVSFQSTWTEEKESRQGKQTGLSCWNIPQQFPSPPAFRATCPPSPWWPAPGPGWKAHPGRSPSHSLDAPAEICNAVG